MKNPEVISIQKWLLRKKFGRNLDSKYNKEFPFSIEYSSKKNFYSSCYNNYGNPKLVKVKKNSHFFKIAILIILFIAIASLIQGTLTNKGSQGLGNAAALSKPWLSERNLWVR